MPDDFVRALIDPTAPLPHGWPAGVLGIFLLFCVPVGGGIPLGVLMARDAGLPPALTLSLYFVSDLVLALTTEPSWHGRARCCSASPAQPACRRAVPADHWA